MAIKRARLGYRLRAIKENIGAAEVIGIDTTRSKIMAAVISGALTACLGTFYAQFQYSSIPTRCSASPSISVRIAMIAIVGGIGTAIGPILGALFIIPMEELANQIFSSRAAGLSQLVFGAILVIVILVEPRGFVAMGRNIARRFGERDSRDDAPLLAMSGISKRFGGLAALSGLTAEIHQGEIVGLIGPERSR